MVIKIRRESVNGDPESDQVASMLWMAEHGRDDDPNVNQVPASVLPELFPAFEVGRWYSLKEVNSLLESDQHPSERAIWTEIAVVVPAEAAPDLQHFPIQIRQHLAARMMFLGAIELAEILEQEGLVRIRVE
jgi:hypothetical protein